MIGERLPTGQLGTDQQSIGDRLMTVSWAYVNDRRKVYDCLETSRRLKSVLGLSATTATSRQPDADQSPTSLRSAKTFLLIDLILGSACSKQNLLATKSNLRPSCDICNLSATSRRPPCDPLATSLRPLEKMVARRSPTSCKKCVTGGFRACKDEYHTQQKWWM